MNWLKDFFFCDTWGDLIVALILGAMGMVVLWFLIVAAIVLLG